MIEQIIVFLIVGAVIAMAGRSIYRTIKGTNNSCGCGGCSSSCSRNTTVITSINDHHA